MSDVIRFIEQLGRHPAGRFPQDYNAAVGSLELTPSERRALLSRDPKALHDLLGAPANTPCMITTPD
ncbi:MAG TPA: hypothetical protein VM619_13970 [Luteimonas sp.]|nr:hypothetical protein [Luteimonas sp.]